MRILLLAPHPFYQARGTPIAVKTVLEFLSGRGDHVDVLTYAEGADVSHPQLHACTGSHGCPACRASARDSPSRRFSATCLMVGSCLRLVRRNRYDLIHAVEESAFIAAAMRTLCRRPLRVRHGLLPGGADGGRVSPPPLGLSRSCGAWRRWPFRRSSGVLAVCAALQDVALGHDPEQLVGRVEDTTLLPRACRPVGAARQPAADRRRPGGDVRRESREPIRASTSCWRASVTRSIGAAGEAGHRRWAGRGHRALSRPGAATGHRPLGPLYRSRARSASCRSCFARPTCWCRPGSRASTPR